MSEQQSWLCTAWEEWYWALIEGERQLAIKDLKIVKEAGVAPDPLTLSETPY